MWTKHAEPCKKKINPSFAPNSCEELVTRVCAHIYKYPCVSREEIASRNIRARIASRGYGPMEKSYYDVNIAIRTSVLCRFSYNHERTVSGSASDLGQKYGAPFVHESSSILKLTGTVNFYTPNYNKFTERRWLIDYPRNLLCLLIDSKVQPEVSVETAGGSPRRNRDRVVRRQSPPSPSRLIP